MGCGTCKGKKSDKVKNNGSDKGTNNLIENILREQNGGKIVSDTFQRMVAKYGTRKEKRLMKRRKKELEGKGDYSDDSELLDIEVFETEENNKNDDEK